MTQAADSRAAMLATELEETYRAITQLTNELEDAKERLEKLSLYDSLTGLPNRSLFHDRFEQALTMAAREKRRFAICMLDLNRFKEVNDTLGHEAGDDVLREVATRIASVTRASDTIARRGGDEFGLLLPTAETLEGALIIIEKISHVLDRPIAVRDKFIDIGVSIGVVLCPDHGTDQTSLIHQADMAMYEAKRRGGGFSVAKGTMSPKRQELLKLSTELRQAVEGDQLRLVYQPIVDLATGRVSRCEALVRWHHPELGVVMPDDFIPLIERTKLITPFTLSVIDLAVKQFFHWKRIGLDIGVAINLSARSLHNRDLPDQIIQRLREREVPPEAIIFEITESAIMTDPSSALEILRDLRAVGICLSVDDFGTGYSSLSYLTRLPISELKIDRSFVSHMRTRKEDMSVVRSIIDLCRNLDLAVVAEGVETEEDEQLLSQFTCDYAQGYYFTRPVPPDEVPRWVANWNRDESMAAAASG